MQAPALKARGDGIVWLLLRKVTLRHWLGEPRQSSLLVLILGLGVAVFMSVRLANRAATAGFQNFTDTLTGQSDFLIKAPAGSLPEDVLGELRSALGPRAVHIIPVVEATAAAPRAAGEADRPWGRTTYQLLGVDLVALSNLPMRESSDARILGSSGQSDEGASGGFWPALRQGPRVFASPHVLETQGTAAGKALVLNIDGKIVSLQVAGVIPSLPDGPRVPDNLVLLDLPDLQELVQRQGRLDRVEFLVEPGAGAEALRAEVPRLLRELSRGRWSVATPGVRRESAETMTRAFRLNLTVLSLVALLVGLYLVLQALDGAVVRRRSEIAVLRSLGLEERTVRMAWLVEAAVLGLAGGVAGVLLGWAGAQVAVRFVGQTVNALYYATTVKAAALEGGEAAVAVALAVGASLAAGWLPAREAARTPPAQILVRHGMDTQGQPLLRNHGLALAAILLGIILCRLPPLHLQGGGRFPLAGYAAAFLWIFGGGILCSLGLPAAALMGARLSRRFVSVRLALSHLVRPSGRHRLAIACLLCSIGMTAGMAILVSSFESTVRGWVGRSLHADLYVSSDGSQSASALNGLEADTWRAIVRHPGVVDATVLSAVPIELDGIQTLLSGTELSSFIRHTDLPWVERPADGSVFDAARNQGLALASESFSERFGMHRGDHVVVRTPAGPEGLTLVGIYADYGNERGSLIVERGDLVRWFSDSHATNVALYLRPGTDPDAVRADLLRRFPGLSIYSNPRLRMEILRIFRQTFSITYALEIIGVAVSVVGMALTLSSVLLDRREELTTLRSLGFTRQEVAAATAAEGLVLTLCSVAGGTLLSLALGWLLIHVINKQSFGWTLGFEMPWGQIAGLDAVVLAAATAVAFAVGRWGAALPSEREE